MTDGFLVTLLNNSYENALLGFANKIWQDFEEENTVFMIYSKAAKPNTQIKELCRKSY